MTKVTIELPEKLSETAHGQTVEISTAEWSPEFLLEHVRQGVRIRLQRAKAGGSVEERLADMNRIVAEMEAGELPTSGARGPRDPEKSLALEMIAGKLVAKKGMTKTQAKEAAPEVFAKQEEAARKMARKELERRESISLDIEL